MEQSDMPLHLSGEAKHNDLVLYARLPAKLTGSLYEPQLSFEPGALLRSRGRIIDSLDIDEIRWPLAGVKLTQRGSMDACRPFCGRTRTRWVILNCIWMARPVTFTRQRLVAVALLGQRGLHPNECALGCCRKRRMARQTY